MFDRYERKQVYEFCRIRSVMVRLDVIGATAAMPDRVEAELVLKPVECNRANDCKREGIRCRVYIEGGPDPCPDAWD